MPCLYFPPRSQPGALSGRVVFFADSTRCYLILQGHTTSLALKRMANKARTPQNTFAKAKTLRFSSLAEVEFQRLLFKIRSTHSPSSDSESQWDERQKNRSWTRSNLHQQAEPGDFFVFICSNHIMYYSAHMVQRWWATITVVNLWLCPVSPNYF